MILNFGFVFDSLNASVRAGDLAYYIPTTTQGAFDMGNSDQAIVFGQVDSIINDENTVVIAWDNAGAIPFPAPTDYIMFSKSSNVNVASLIGYYAEVSLVNDSHEYVELYSVGSQVSENSK